MSYGFTSYNTSGFLQISEDYINLRIIASGTATHTGYTRFLGSDGDYKYGTRVTFPENVAPLILIQSKTDCFICVTYVSSTEFVFSLTTTAGPFNGTISYKVLGVGSTVSSDSYGLRYWGSQGQLIFDSGSSYAKGAEVLTSPVIFSTIAGGFFVAQAPINIGSLTYSGAPWIFCTPIGPTFMYNIDFGTPANNNWAIGIGFKYSTGNIQLGTKLILNHTVPSYKIASGGERIGDPLYLGPINYNYYNKFILGEVS